MISIWEKETLLKSDFLIIGAGITGLSTAAAILEAKPKARVRVLERGILPSGASTKNAGFACLGSLSELSADVAHFGEEQVKASLKLKYEGLKLLRKRLGNEAIGYEAHGGYELLLPKHAAKLEEIDTLNALTNDALGVPLFQVSEEQEFGFNKDQISALIQLPYEGQLDTGKAIDSLLRYVCERGGEVLTGCEVSHWEEKPEGVEIRVQDYAFTASQVIFCTNGFSQKIFPDIDLKPGRGQVLVTDPIPDLPFRGAFHFDEGYFYFRDYQGGVLFGGGRNLNREVETTTELEITHSIQHQLETYLKTLILPNQEFTIRHRWAGSMG
ncbi:MAG: FAD-dependent oxidoreductase, partial [Bacteroidota bacterium]